MINQSIFRSLILIMSKKKETIVTKINPHRNHKKSILKSKKMAKPATLFLLLGLLVIFIQQSRAQVIHSDTFATETNSNVSVNESSRKSNKGTLFISPYYQYSYFQKLKLISHRNSYSLAEGESYYDYTSDEISKYNNHYKTNYTNNLIGLRIGYQAIGGIGVNAFLGVNHYKFRSWISDENTQSVSTKYPALTFGCAANYLKSVKGKLYLMAYSSVTGSIASAVLTDNNSGEEVVKSELKSFTWDADLAIGYKVERILPYGGVGFTQQFIHMVTKEQIPTTDSNGNPFLNQITFDSRVRGHAVYGFAGLQYKISPLLTVYARCAFLNPLRISTGLNITLN